MNTLTLLQQSLLDRLGVAPERVTPEASLASLGVDSLMLLELVFELEEHLGIALPLDTETPRTVGDLVALAERLRRGAA
ncbi:MAG: acyl carrier protein [Betaproteobacteria bacterium]|nr:acyl carrier protein [Betaproteobacteria bacterium]